MKETGLRRKISIISTWHYIKLVFRSILFLAAAILYFSARGQGIVRFETVQDYPFLLRLIWIIFVVEMIARCFPSRMESMGCQKQFVRNYVPVENSDVREFAVSWKITLAMVVAWGALNGLIGILFFIGVIDEGILLLIALAYSVCDMICILFFCPFQTWFMKNKCCGTCRIYNWDYAMMFTPFLFIRHAYTWSLLGMALVLLVIWEVLYHLHPERFYDGTNQSLMCANCQEKLCHHKKQLRQFARFRR